MLAAQAVVQIPKLTQSLGQSHASSVTADSEGRNGNPRAKWLVRLAEA